MRRRRAVAQHEGLAAAARDELASIYSAPRARPLEPAEADADEILRIAKELLDERRRPSLAVVRSAAS